MRVSNFSEALKAAQVIKESGVFVNLCNAVLIETFQLAATDEIIVPANAHAELDNALACIRNKTMLLVEVLDDVLPEQEPLSVSIRLPNGSDLESTSDNLKKLDLLLNQLVVNSQLSG